MKNIFKNNTGGFTLIELLVVVLIIGILSAVALPQYQKAVFKSRMAEAFTNLKTISETVKLCELENGKVDWGNNEICAFVENLSINIGEESVTTFITDKFEYRIDRGGLSKTENVVVNALATDYQVCMCIYDDGSFKVLNENAGCGNGHFPNFDIAKTLNIPADEGCWCC